MTRSISLLLLVYLFSATTVCAQENKTQLEIFGFIMADGGYNFNSIDPNWFDVMRPTKLPSRAGEFGTNGNAFFSVRQTRFGIRSSTPTRLGELKTEFLFDLFGFGKNQGQTTIHLINAYGEMGKLLVGQTASVFMDQMVFPVTLDYWGPMTRIFNFNVQVRYSPINNDKQRLAIAVERPGATADGGDDLASIQLGQVKPVFRVPNLTAHYRFVSDWGHAQLGLLAKSMKWADVSGSPSQDLSGSAFGWGWSVSASFKATPKLTLKTQVLQGHGIQSHIADAPADVVVASNPGNPSQPAKGIAQPVVGFFGFLEYDWNPQWKTSVGYSQEDVENGNLQTADAFRKGQYALANLVWLPSENMLLGVEYQYGKRHNYNDGFTSSAHKLQVSFKLNFSTLAAIGH